MEINENIYENMWKYIWKLNENKWKYMEVQWNLNNVNSKCKSIIS